MRRTQDLLDDIFFALRDATRREMLSRLAQGSATVGELGKPFRISAPAVSRHLRTLETAGLIERRVVGRTHLCSLAPKGLEIAENWLNFHGRFWESQLDELGRFLKRKKTKKRK